MRPRHTAAKISAPRARSPVHPGLEGVFPRRRREGLAHVSRLPGLLAGSPESPWSLCFQTAQFLVAAASSPQSRRVLSSSQVSRNFAELCLMEGLSSLSRALRSPLETRVCSRGTFSLWALSLISSSFPRTFPQHPSAGPAALPSGPLSLPRLFVPLRGGSWVVWAGPPSEF